MSSKNLIQQTKSIEHSLFIWAADSVGFFTHNYSTIRKFYVKIPSIVKDNLTGKEFELADSIEKNVRKCGNIFGALKGNRTCFMICP